MKTLFVMSLMLLATASRAHAEPGQLLLSLNYHLSANIEYTTDLYRVNDAPVSTSAIRIMQSGSPYCDIRISRVEYTTFDGDYLHDARPAGVGTSYAIAEGRLRAVKIHFRQNYWDGVDCALVVYSADGGGPGPSLGWKSDAHHASLNVRLLRWSFSQHVGYESLVSWQARLAAATTTLQQAADDGMSTASAYRLYLEVQDAYSRLAEAFYPIHNRYQNAEVDRSWRDFVSAMEALRRDFR